MKLTSKNLIALIREQLKEGFPENPDMSKGADIEAETGDRVDIDVLRKMYQQAQKHNLRDLHPHPSEDFFVAVGDGHQGQQELWLWGNPVDGWYRDNEE